MKFTFRAGAIPRATLSAAPLLCAQHRLGGTHRAISSSGRKQLKRRRRTAWDTPQGLARGNVDTDATIDVWSISTASRAFPTTVDVTCSVGANNPGGEPANDVNDVNF
jgi:hypothetical protein